MKVSRRAMLGGSVGGFFAYALRNQAAGLLANGLPASVKRCVVLWMNGGPSQIDTIDPKPNTANGGEFRAISTSVPGIQVSETLPKIAKQMDSLALLRNLTSSEGEHERGQYYLHTGYSFIPGFPRPSLGSIASHEAPRTAFPQYVSIGSPGYGPAFLGPDHAPFSIENPREALELMRRIGRRKQRLALLQELGSDFDSKHATSMLDRRRSMIARIESLVSTPFVESLNLEREPASQRARYGEHSVGKACLLARRLLETGVRFVEVRHDGWDTHVDNFRRTRELAAAIDQPWAALMDDLRSSGLWDETLVLWLGEFGRTPNVNAQRGRDHFPKVTPVVLGGGVVRGGRVVGQTNLNGTEIDGESHRVADLFATVLQMLGIDPASQFTTAFGSPTSATDDGKPIAALL